MRKSLRRHIDTFLVTSEILEVVHTPLEQKAPAELASAEPGILHYEGTVKLGRGDSHVVQNHPCHRDELGGGCIRAITSRISDAVNFLPMYETSSRTLSETFSNEGIGSSGAIDKVRDKVRDGACCGAAATSSRDTEISQTRINTDGICRTCTVPRYDIRGRGEG